MTDSKVRRFGWNKFGDNFAERHLGDYVLAADYLELQAKLDAAVALLRRVPKLLEDWHSAMDLCPDDEHEYMANVEAFLATLSPEIDQPREEGQCVGPGQNP